MSQWFVYMVECADGSLYTGITTDLHRRVAEHNSDGPQAAHYTRSRAPVSLVYQEPWPDRAAASRREAALKRLSRAEKQALIRAAR